MEAYRTAYLQCRKDLARAVVHACVDASCSRCRRGANEWQDFVERLAEALERDPDYAWLVSLRCSFFLACE